jgi:hypothetical protein
MKPINLVQFAAICLVLTRIANASILYGIGPWEAGMHSNLYRIDKSTGAATLVGDTGFDRFNGLAFRNDGVLFGYRGGALYSINSTSGAATQVGLLGINSPEGGLAFHPTTGVLFGVSSTLTDTLLTIDTTTGVATAIAPLGSAGRDVSGLAFNASGTLYGAAFRDNNADNLVTINTTTGAAFTIGPLGTNQGPAAGAAVGGLEFDPQSGILYYSEGINLYTVNPSTGAASLIGPHGVEIAGLAAVVPEPAAAMALLASPMWLVAGAVFVRRRRHR